MPPRMSAPANLAIHHVAVLVHDLDRAEAFYADVLGLPVQRRWADEGGAPRSLWLTLGGGAFLALEKAGPSGATAGGSPPLSGRSGWHCVALAIAREERESWRARLASAGFPVERESPFTLYARDPEGNLVALSHHPDPA
jgi:catechol 2,3-dioxygenase-like lactoylglutathione lyase family enzyme